MQVDAKKPGHFIFFYNVHIKHKTHCHCNVLVVSVGSTVFRGKFCQILWVSLPNYTAYHGEIVKIPQHPSYTINFSPKIGCHGNHHGNQFWD